MNIMAPLVSVIIPTYNRADIVGKSIESVLNQTYKNIELIVVDDGSTDNTEETLSKYKKEIRYFKQNNKGVSAARNLGIKQSNGEYIAFIDSDDIWKSNKLEKQIKFFDENKSKNVAMVSTDVIVKDSDGSEKDRRRLIKRHDSCILGFIDVFRDPYLGLPTVMLRRDVINTGNLFDEKLRTAEDIDLYLNISLKYNIGYLHEKLVEVHKTEGSLSENINSYGDNIYVVKRFVENNKELFGNYQKIVSNILYDIIYDYAKTLLWNRHPKECREQLKSSYNYKITLPSLLLYLKSFLVFG